MCINAMIHSINLELQSVFYFVVLYQVIKTEIEQINVWQHAMQLNYFILISSVTSNFLVNLGRYNTILLLPPFKMAAIVVITCLINERS